MADDGDIGDMVVKWAGKEVRVKLAGLSTVADLRRRLAELTGVTVPRQKLLGLPRARAVFSSGADTAAEETVLLSTLGLRRDHKLMLLGSTEAEVAEAAAVESAARAAAAEVQDDLDLPADRTARGYADVDADADADGDTEADTARAIAAHPANLAKVDARVRGYRPKLIAGPRGEGKRCLVLDVDFTLFDHRSVAESARDLARPHLHWFLARAYQEWDLVLWSATSMQWVELKARELGLLDHPDFRLAMLYCINAMVTVKSDRHGGVVAVKPLAVIWGQHPAFYAPANTVHVDDLGRNFLMNHRSGIKIRPCRKMVLAQNRAADAELRRLAAYLDLLLAEADCTAVDHSDWEGAVRRRARAWREAEE